MPHQYSIFETTLKKHGRRWRWRVCTAQGEVVMGDSENSRAAARYKSNQALFLLFLSAPFASARKFGVRSLDLDKA
jgi:hypothetical protein